MAYTPPANNAVNFALSSYTAPANNAVSFEVNPSTGITGTVAEAQAKSTEVVSGGISVSGTVVETLLKQIEAISGALSYTASVIEDQPKQTEEVTGTIPATPITGTVDEQQARQEESARCVIADTAVEVDFNGGGWKPFDPYGEIADSKIQKVGGSVSEKTRKNTESIIGTLSISATVKESVTIQSRMTARIGRNRAEREMDIQAILTAVA